MKRQDKVERISSGARAVLRVSRRVVLVAVALTALLSAAEGYDEKLEFVESTGTQWMDTGIRLNWRRSAMELDFRVLKAPSARVCIAGMTGTAGHAEGGDSVRRTFVLTLGQPSDGKYQILPSFTGGIGGGYRWPDNNDGTDDFGMTWNVRSGWAFRPDGDYKGTNQFGYVNGRARGGYYRSYPDEESACTFYIGAANNAGTGLLTPEDSLAKIQWYGVRLYTDGALVGDFIPVKKGGVAGFYDNVSQTFFASQGADAWVAPTAVVWTGAGATDNLADATNWEGGTAPATRHDVAVIPDGQTLAASAEDLAAAFNGLGGVRLAGANAVLHINGVETATALDFPVGGTGTYRLENVVSSAVALTLRQSLWNFYGTTQITNVYTFVNQPSALGLAGRSTADVYLAGDTQRLSLYGGGTSAAISLRRSGELLYFSNNFTAFDRTAWSFPANSVGTHGNGNAEWRLLGPLVGRADAQNTFTPHEMSSCWLEDSVKDLKLTQLIVNCGTLHVNAPVHSTARAKDAAGAGQDQANIRVNAGKNLVFGQANALDANCFVQVGYATGPTGLPANVIDLGGTDQRLGTLGVWAASFDGATDWNPNLVLKSDAPATLTLHGQLRTATDATSRHVFPGLVSGAVSVALDSREDVMAEAWNWPDATVPGGIRFNCPGSDTSGTLSSARGTLEVMATATFPNLSSVVVSGTGVVRLATGEVGSANPFFTVEVRDETARLELASGVTLVCNTCALPGGVALAPGCYSAAASEGVAACAVLSGEGVLEVKNALWTGWPTAGSVTRAEIPQGTAVTIADADIANVEALEEIVCHEGVTISVETTEPLDIRAKISGPVTVSGTGTGKVSLSGDNAGVVAPGHFAFTDLTNGLSVAHFNGLGGEATAAAVLTQTQGRLDWLSFAATGGVFTNSVPLQFVHAGGIGNAVWLGAADAGETLVFANDLDFGATGENYWYIRNHVQIVHGTFAMGGHVRLYAAADGARLEILGDTEAVLGKGGGQAIIYLSNGVTFGGKSVWAKNGLSTDAARSVTFAKANCLGPDCILASYVNGSATHFDFCGYDQEIGRLRHVNAAADMPQLKSDTPATLKAVGDVAATETVRYAFKGALAYWHDTVQNLTFEAPSTSTGALTVSKGSLSLTGAAGWAGAAVTVKAGGTLVCAATDSLVSGQHVLTVEKGGALTVGSGVTLKVQTATLGDVVLEPDTVYTVAQLQALATGVTLAGEGAIQTGAKSIAGDWNGWPDVGTATVAQIPDGLTVEVLEGDLAKVAALETVECGANTKVVFRTVRDTLRLATKFAGGATVELLTDGATVVLDGDNSGLVSPGGFVFSNTTVIVSNRFGLGSRRTAPAAFWPAAPWKDNQSRLFFDGPATVTNDCALLFNYGCQVGHRDADVRFVQANDVVQKNGLSYKAQRFAITNDLTLAAGFRMDLDLGGTDQPSGSHFRIEDGATFNASGNYGVGTYHIAGDCTGRFNVEQGMTAFIFERTNVCDGIVECRYLDASWGQFRLDLNGYDQAIPCVRGNSYWNVNQQTLTVTSAVPATLTLTGVLGAGVAASHGVALRLEGQASLVKCGAYTQTVGCATSTTRGTLTVNGGTFVFERGAKWTGGDIAVNGGEILVREDSVAGVFGTGRRGSPSLFVNGDGRLNLPAADTEPLTVRTVSRNGVQLEGGDYSAATCDWIVGAGTVRVRRGPPKGLLWVVR